MRPFKVEPATLSIHCKVRFTFDDDARSFRFHFEAVAVAQKEIAFFLRTIYIAIDGGSHVPLLRVEMTAPFILIVISIVYKTFL